MGGLTSKVTMLWTEWWTAMFTLWGLSSFCSNQHSSWHHQSATRSKQKVSKPAASRISISCLLSMVIHQVSGGLLWAGTHVDPLLSVYITAKWQTPAHRPPPTLIGPDRCWGIFASPCPSKSLGRCVALSVIFSSSHPLSMARGVSRLCQHQALIPRAIFDIRSIWTVVQLKHFYLLFELPGHDRHYNTESPMFWVWGGATFCLTNRSLRKTFWRRNSMLHL